IRSLYSAALALRAGFFSAASGGFRFGAAFALAGALRALLRALTAGSCVGVAAGSAPPLLRALLAGGFAAAFFFSPPPPARASLSPTACSSVMASGVMSGGSVALTPSWLTYGP